MQEDESGEGDTRALFDLLIEPTTGEILHVVDEEALPAKDIAERCDVSGPTIYRKLNAMQEFDLLATRTEIDRYGNHYTVYESNVDHVQISLTPSENEIGVDVTYRSTTEQFIHLWEEFKQK